MLEEKLERSVEQSAAALTAMADDFFDHPEVGLQEFHAFETLTGWLEKEGFTVERGIAGMDTAFRAVWKHGEGGPNIGLLCEYDALAGLGHACGHHMQGPAILGAAKALKDAAIDAPYTITVYGTPAEESISGKVVMLENGCTFEELDVALMMHGGPATQVDVKSLALNKLKIIYHGVCSLAALKPEKGRSALDGLILACQGVEFLREHVPSDVRMHYTIVNCGGTAANVVPGYAGSAVTCPLLQPHGVRRRGGPRQEGTSGRSHDDRDGSGDHRGKEPRQQDPGAGSQRAGDGAGREGPCSLHPSGPPEDRFHRLRQRDAPCARHLHPRGLCPGGRSGSQEYLDAGKTEAAHNAVVYGAKILALTGAQLIEDPEKLEAIKKEFHENLAKELNGQS